jgi:uncharacterized protein with PhoU and TrkA domain
MDPSDPNTFGKSIQDIRTLGDAELLDFIISVAGANSSDSVTAGDIHAAVGQQNNRQLRILLTVLVAVQVTLQAIASIINATVK